MGIIVKDKTTPKKRLTLREAKPGDVAIFNQGHVVFLVTQQLEGHSIPNFIQGVVLDSGNIEPSYSGFGKLSFSSNVLCKEIFTKSELHLIKGYYG